MLLRHKYSYLKAPRGHARRGGLCVQASAEPPQASPRKNISQRIEQLKLQNELLKQAIGVFLDRPEAGDVGVVTGKPTGAWDGSSTASLIDTLRKRPGDPNDVQPVELETVPGISLQGDEIADDEEPDSPSPYSSFGAEWDESNSSALADIALKAEALAAEAAAANAALAAAIREEPEAPDAVPYATVEFSASSGYSSNGSSSNGSSSNGSSSNGSSSNGSSSNGSSSNGRYVGVVNEASATASSDATAAVQPAAAAAAVVKKPIVLGNIHDRVEQMERQLHQQQQAAQKQHKPAVKPRATARKPPVCSTPLDIVFVSAEVAPWSKTGGLGDVMGALPQAMAARGHRVMVVTPRYTNGGKDAAKYKEAKPLDKSVWVELNNSWHELKYHVATKGGVDWVFIEHMCYQREGTPYGDASGPFQDNLFRFALLCLGALEAPLNLPIKRDSSGNPLDEVYGQNIMFVANDWHAALLPLLLTARFRPYGVYPNARCCLAIHNLSHQGSFEAHKFHDLGLPGEWYGTLEWENPEDRHRRKTINVLKAGIVTSDLLLTVSQGYAAEITGMPQDARVDMLLAQRANKLRGIVNGIDMSEWDPATDKHLAARYSADDLSGKAACKRALQREMRLPMDPDLPLIGFIGRLDYQKGPDLVLDALPILANLDCQVVLLGTGAADYEARVKAASHEHGWFCRGHVGFSVPLSHKIIAGCDILIMPSRFEPCGLNQMYAMRYGTVPIAHATGGLIDTIQDYNPFAKGDGEGTGWTFAPAAVEPMVAAVSTAVKVFREEPERWQALQLRCMGNDSSWEHAAQQYETVLCEVMADAVQYTGKK